VQPLLLYATSGPAATLQKNILEPRPENRIFWPVMVVISVVLAVQNRSRLGKLPSPIIALFACLAFAGASVLWAYAPQSSFVRFVQQVMVVLSIILPAMLAARTTDMMRGLFLCFAFASILNVLFVLGGSPEVATYGAAGKVNIGYTGYFLGKNYLGECAATALLLAFHEMLYPGSRRALGAIVAFVAILLIFWANSKTALGLALVAPLLAGLTLFIAKKTRISPAIILLSIPTCYGVLSSVSHVSMNRMSYELYGDSTFTGRTLIWDFAQSEINRSPLLGYGYQSFWLVPNAPSAVDGRGWIRDMPNAHSGFYDTTLEMGYIGFALLLFFIIATVDTTGRVAERDRARAWLVLSLALYIILFNYLESLWMRGFEFLWVVFLIVTAEISRFGQLPLTTAAYGLRTARPDYRSPSQGAQSPRKRLQFDLNVRRYAPD
jgi:O-antigen ligase